MKDKKQVKVYLSAEAHEILRDHAAKFGMSMSQDMEKTVREVLKPELEEGLDAP